jgi:hypothetical protein
MIMTNREMVKDPRVGGPKLPEPNLPQRVLVPSPAGDPDLFNDLWRDQPHWLTDEEGTRIGRPNSEGARITPRPQESSTSLQKGLALSAEESVAVVARPIEPRRETGQRGPPQPRCREANGGVAVVAAGAAMNRNGGHHAEVAHP